MRTIIPFSFYFLHFGAYATLAPFFTIFYQSLGFTGIQIGLLTGVPPLVTLFATPVGTALADRTRRHKLIMGLGIVVAIVVMLIIPQTTNFFSVFALIVFFNIFMSPVGALTDSATMTMLGQQREIYGRVRIGGTIGWGIFAQFAGVVFGLYGLNILFYVFSGVMMISLFVSQKFSFSKHNEQAQDSSTTTIFIQSRFWIIFLASSFLGGAGSFSVASYLSPYLQELGANGKQIGFAFFIGSLAELPAFYFGNLLVKRFTARRLFVISLALLGIRSVLFGLAGNLFVALAIQAGGGAFFPLMWLAGVAYVDENTPTTLKTTSQGLFSAVTFGLGAAISGFVGGLLFDSFGGHGMFLFFGIAILIGLTLLQIGNSGIHVPANGKR